MKRFPPMLKFNLYTLVLHTATWYSLKIDNNIHVQD